MNIFRLNSLTTWLAFTVLLTCVLTLGSGLSTSAKMQQQDEGPNPRHICPVEAIRNGTCDPNPAGHGKSGPPVSAQRKQPQYKRVAKQTSTAAKCINRVKETHTAKSQTGCGSSTQAVAKVDLPLSSQKVGVTIWKVREARRGYNGARILWYPKESKSSVQYEAERISGEPVLAYGEKVRLGIESPRDGYLYVFDREIYHDGSLSAPYMIFPISRLRDGNNRIRANRPIELPALVDDPFFFEAKKVGLDPSKRLVGEVLSIAITDKPITRLSNLGQDAVQVSAADMEFIERLYTGYSEVFELEGGVSQPYSETEREAANTGARLLTYADPVPQTFYLVEDKHNGGLLVSLVLKYQDSGGRSAHRQ
ncbi:MAG TPA: DUF4384 domain-containing protein [Pyrinomonadaceae bacterium]|nr:DUF4384 domain-containing protein [Pyrinomonadaceae bacterium]